MLLFWIYFSSICFVQLGDPSFEGIVYYKQSYQYSDGAKSLTLVDTIQTFLKNGYIKKVYKDGSAAGIKMTLYNPLENRMYMVKNSFDTLFYYRMDVNKNTALVNIKETPSDSILGQRCKALQLTYAFQNADTRFLINETYYYSDNLPFKPNLFDRYKFAFWDQASKTMKSFYLKYEQKSPATTEINEAFAIVPTKLDDENFMIPKDLPLVEFHL